MESETTIIDATVPRSRRGMIRLAAALAFGLGGVSRANVAAREAESGDDHGGHGADDPPGDDHGAGNDDLPGDDHGGAVPGGDDSSASDHRHRRRRGRGGVHHGPNHG